MEIKEEWRPIKDFEGLYEVSNLGEVRSLGRCVKANKSGTRFVKDRILSKGNSRNGYLSVVLSKDGKHHCVSVHRLVALAFIQNPNNYREVNHKDENKHNNRVENLEWCDRVYNANFGTGVARCSIKRLKPVRMFNLQGDFIKEFASAREANIITGVSYKNISSVCRGHRRCAGNYLWRFSYGN